MNGLTTETVRRQGSLRMRSKVSVGMRFDSLCDAAVGLGDPESVCSASKVLSMKAMVGK